VPDRAGGDAAMTGELWPGDALTAADGAEYVIGRQIGAAAAPDDGPCDHPSASIGPDGACRCVVCSRCGHHTGNAHQGHYWSYCIVTGTDRGFHMCCPGNCEIEAGDQP